MSECGYIDCCPVDGLNKRIKELEAERDLLRTRTGELASKWRGAEAENQKLRNSNMAFEIELARVQSQLDGWLEDK